MGKQKFFLLACVFSIPLMMNAGAFIAEPNLKRAGAIFNYLDPNLPRPDLHPKIENYASGDTVIVMNPENFQFVETCKTESENIPRGHVHIYVNGVKRGTAYRPDYSLGKLAPGKYEILLTLQSSDHRAWIGEKGLIYKKFIIEQGA